ncbi:MAG: hypothetical protein PHU23_19720 [Dehalococcoidales bacterium]|nr:hypothetical protein [Dehalococcoidales bacterium]
MPSTKKNKKVTVSKVTKKPVKKTAKKVKKVETPVAPPVVVAPPPAPPAPPVKTEAEKIWDEIKNRPIQMFGLPDQYVFQHATFVTVEPTSLYVTIRSSATLPSLEAAIGPNFTVELADKFVIIKRVPAPLIPSKKR